MVTKSKLKVSKERFLQAIIKHDGGCGFARSDLCIDASCDYCPYDNGDPTRCNIGEQNCKEVLTWAKKELEEITQARRKLKWLDGLE